MSAYARPTLGHTRLTFFGTIRSEWIKFWSLRSSGLVLGAFLAASAGFGVVLFLNAKAGANAFTPAVHAVEKTAQLTVLIASLLASLIGLLTITNEYGSGQFRASFMAVPKRAQVIWAKACLLSLVAVLASVVSLLIGHGLAWLILGDLADLRPLADAGDRILIGAVLNVVALTLLGLMVGALVRSTVGAATTVVVLVVILPAAADLIRSAVINAAAGAYPLWRRLILYCLEVLPTTASHLSLVWEPATDSLAPSLQLSPWTGLAVMFAWVVVFALPALIRLRVRDA
ncbi:MAG: ABC transporter permease [Propionibacteriaceae bacterium]|jgi:ABC-2 type transport system permease protein|nr:ABC transporter permease [Propionibacteriaceae bacterium]